MTHEVPVGIRVTKIHHGEYGTGHLPDTYKFEADTIGGYGICSDGRIHTHALVSVNLPDEIVISKEHWWEELVIPGRKGNSGMKDRCFVVCNTRAEQECTYFGELRAKELIQKAINSGMTCIYPDEQGKMRHMPVDVNGIRWMEYPPSVG